MTIERPDLPPGRMAFLDGLRAFAALWVVLGHAHLLVLGWNRSGTLWGRPLDLLLYSHLAVVIFLVLSGFCLALPVVQNGGRLVQGNLEFFKARAWRILPPYYAALFLLLAVNAFVPVASWGRHPVGLTSEISWQVMWTNLLLLQDVFWQFNSINGAFWSIACEFHLYFTFPALVWVLRRHGVLALVLVAAVVAAVLTWLSFQRPHLSEAVPVSIPQPPYFILLFALGAAAAALACGPRFAPVRALLQRRAWLLAFATCIPLCALLWRYRIVDGNNVWDFINRLHWIDPLAGLVTACGLVGLAGLRPGHGLRRVFENRAMVGTGAFSYSLYLTHVPILAAINKLLLEDTGLSGRAPLTAFFALAIGGTLVSMLFASGFARLFEVRYRGARPASGKAGGSAPVPAAAEHRVD